MNQKMDAIVKNTAGPGLELRQVPVPVPGPGEVLIKIHKTAICGSDVHIYKWNQWAQQHVKPPMTIGHEYVGEIAELGAGVTGLRIGQRVSGEGHITCHRCRNCHTGNIQWCKDTVGVGVDRDGAFAEYVCIPETNVIPIDESLPEDVVAFFDAFGNATHTALMFPLVGEDVLITGAGPIGIIAAGICKYAGARRVIITDINEYRLEKEAPIDILAVDNTAVRESQIKRLKELRANRDEAAVKKALAAITECVKTKQGNLLELAVEAAKVRASLGEISDACEVVVGRYKAVIRSISGVYSSEVKNDKSFERAKELCAEFAKKEGRQPRVMIAKLGQDGHDRGAKVVATGYADIGFDVDMGPLFQTPEEAAKQAVENDVHVVGVSSLAAGHLTLVPQIIAELKKLGREDIIVIVGGVIPAQDYDELYRDGAAAIFGPGTPIATAAIKILEILLAE